MTAPAIAQAPAASAAPAEVAAPVIEQVADETPQAPETVRDKIDRLAKKVTPESQGLAPREDDPNAAPADALLGGPTDTVPPPTVAPESIVRELTIEDPDGTVELRSRAEDGRFEPLDTSKKYELRIKDKETGETKVYNKELPDILRLAKDGIAMQKSRDELSYYRQNVPKWTQSDTQLRQELEGHKALALALLTEDEPSVVARREAYRAQFTPEAENQRLRQQLSQLTSQANTPIVQQPQRVDTTPHVQALASRIGQTVAEVEGLVGKERAAGKIALDLSQFYVNGQIPVERFPQLEQYVNGPFKQWAQAEAAKATQDQTAAQTALAEAKRTQQAAQQAARTVGTATRPSPVSPNQNAAPKPIRSKEDAISRIISRPIGA